MSIPTKMSLVGFIVSPSKLSFTSHGEEYTRVRIGVELWRREADGTRRKLDPTYHDMVAFRTAAREIYNRFRPGDEFVASGYINQYEVDRAGGSVVKDEFVAEKIGHNANRTNYTVQRLLPAPAEPAPTPASQPPAVGF